MQETLVQFLGWEDPPAKKGYPLSILGLLPWCPDSKESACSVGDLGLIPASRRSPGEGHGNPLQYSYLENSMDRGAWRATAHGVTNRWT